MNGDDDVFADALAVPTAERSAFLDAACAQDPTQRARIAALLAGYDHAQALMNSPLAPRFTRVPEEPIGASIGRYKLLQKIGEGGMGVVYLAQQDVPVRRRVALKIIKLGMDTKEVITRFEAERQALAMMDHPSIARVFDGGATDSGRPYFVMELVRGIRITDYCDEAQLSTRDRLDLFIQVCQAIQHAHQKGIIHRDIKPSNILVTVNDGVAVPKVIDFGIAKATAGRLTDATLVTQFEAVIGTPAYMSPEQAVMTSVDIDTRCDIYSLGVVLYELLAGRTPFDGKELLSAGLDAMRKTIREKEPARPSARLATLRGEELSTTAKRRSADTAKLIHQLQGDLDWIVMKCLEKDRARRYDTANGLAADLKRHLDHEPVVARPPSAVYRLQKMVQRNKLLVTAATAVATALFIGLGVSTWQMFEARKAQRETATARDGERVQRIEAESAQTKATTEARKSAASEQHARRLLYASDMNLVQQTLKLNNLGHARRLLDRHRPSPGEEDLRGWEWRYLWQLTRAGGSTLAHRDGARGCSVSSSPDGTRVAVGYLGGRVDVWDVPGRRLIRTITDLDEDRHQGRVAFSPIRNVLAATPAPKVVTLYDLDSGRESILWRAPDEDPWMIREISFSPDGSKVLIYTRLREPVQHDEVWVVNVASTRIESRHVTDFTFSTSSVLGAARISPDNQRLYITCGPGYSGGLVDAAVRCIDLNTRTVLWETESQRTSGTSGLALSQDGRVLATCGGNNDTTIRVIDALTGRMLEQLSGHEATVRSVAFSHDGRFLISAARDQTIRYWDTRSWLQTKVLQGHTDDVWAVAVSPATGLVASTGNDGRVMLWGQEDSRVEAGYRRFPEHHQVLSLDGARVLLLSKGKPPGLIDLRRDSPPVLLPEIKSSDEVLGWFAPNLLCQWDGSSILVQQLRGTELVPRAVFKSDSGTRPTYVRYNTARQLLGWSESTSPGHIFLGSLATPGRRMELKSDSSGVLDLRFSQDGHYLAACAREGLRPLENEGLHAWEIDTGRMIRSSGGKVGNAYFAAGGRMLVAFSQKGSGSEIEFHDLAQPGQAPHRHSSATPSRSQAMLGDGSLIAASGEGGVRIFDPVTGKLAGLPLHGHLNQVHGVAFSPDERRVISSASAREAIKVWDLVTRQELLNLSGTGAVLWEARWSADGNAIFAGPPWQAWTAPTWEEIAAAETKP